MNPHTLESMNEFVAAHGGRAAGPPFRTRGLREIATVFSMLEEMVSAELAIYKRSKSDADRFGTHVIEFDFALPFERHCFFFGFTSEKPAMACWAAIVPEDEAMPLRLRTKPRPVSSEDEMALAGVIV